MANILILGGGFGGLMMAEQLSDLFGNSGHRITLVSPKDKFTFYPALVRLAFGDCSEENISIDLPEKLNDLNVRFVQGEVIKLNQNLKQVQIAGEDFNGEISYDYLVIAMGRRLATEKIGGFFEHAHHLLGSKAALKFGEAVESFKKGHIVVGLSPQAFLPVPVCETAFALAKKFEREIEKEKISVSVIFPETIETAFGGADLHEKLEKAFAFHHIEVITDFAVKEVTEKAIVSAEGQKIKYDLLMLLPPFRGQAMIGKQGFTDELDFVEVDDFLRVVNLENAYAVGDIASFTGPKLAFTAIRQAQVAAENIATELRGGTPTKLYQHDISLIIDEGGDDAIFLHYGVLDNTLYGLKTGKMWSRMKNEHNLYGTNFALRFHTMKHHNLESSI
jgi:sulfide:quinone oxidoreductase